MASDGKGVSLHTKILLALVLGAVAGSIANALTQRWPQEALLPLAVAPNAGVPAALPWMGLVQQFQPPPPTWCDLLIQYVMNPIGQIFLRLLFLTVVPLVFASLSLGVAQLGSRGNLGRIGLKTFVFFLATMTTAVIIGLLLVNLIQPGVGLPGDTSERLLRLYGSEAAARSERPAEFGIDTFVNIVPRNPLAAMVDMDMLAIIFVALLIGMGLTLIERSRAQAVMQLLEAINDLMVVIIGWAMRIAPYGVFALIFAVTARFGFDLLRPLGLYVVVVLVGLAIQMFGVLSLLLFTLAHVNPLEFFRRVRDVLITAFSTSSSNATLPTSIKVAEEELGVPSAIAGFVLPLGATMNMNGTALFEGVTVVFLAQVFGVQLAMLDQIVVVTLAVMMAIGAAGVPGGSMPLLVMILATIHVPEMGIALILGVDRLLDMSRTTLNVIGDITAATVVARSEGFAIMPAKSGAH